MKKYAATIGLILGILLAACGSGEHTSIIPVPLSVELQKRTFTLNGHTRLWMDAPEGEGAYLKEYIDRHALGQWSDTRPTDNAIILELADSLPGINKAEGYVLSTDKSGVRICALSEAGLFYGIQTLLQISYEDGAIAYGTIVDEPRFEYRGMMLDVSRHFFDADFIKKQIEAMAYYKLNHLHLHLTDAAGWRIEIKRYPELTRQAAWRTHALWKDWWNGDRHYAIEGEADAHGGYYTQEQIRDIVAYAQKHYITVIPEIEMPSHSEEVLTVYPELSCSHTPYKEADFCAGNEKVFEFIENVLLEVMELFPSHYIHIGGDEASKQSWKECALCKARMQQEGLDNVDELQSYFIHRIEKFLNAHGRSLLGWDEILDGGLAPHASVMSWRGTDGGLKAMQMGHRAIMTPGEFCYFDAYQDAPHTQPEAFGGYLPLQKVYSYDPIPDTLDHETAQLLYGVQGNLFAEYIPTEEHMEYMAYPRILALAEVAWSAPENKCFEDFHARALKAVEALRAKGYHPFDLHHDVGNRPGADKPIRHLGVGKRVVYADGSAYYKGYAAGGDSALVDGIRGGWTYGDKRWQGFLGRKGVDAIIDLGETTPITTISADFMQICGPGVFMPAQVIISVSHDGETFTELKREEIEVVKDDAVTFKTFGWEGAAEARYVRYQALRSDFGGFLFIDEIVIE
jgi:hexosaminidase